MKKIILFILLGIMGFFLFINFNEDKEKKMRLEVNEYTLRYYDKEGLFPHLKRVNGVRQFSENEIETLRIYI